MTLHFRIFLFAAAIIFIVGATFTFSSYFAKVVGFQPIQFNAFKDSKAVDIVIFNEEDKTIFSLKDNQFYLLNQSSNIKLPNEVFGKILSIKIPKVRREAFFDGFFEHFKDPILTFTIEDNTRQGLTLEFFKENSDTIKLKVIEMVPIGIKNDTNTYFTTITKDDNLFKIVNLLKNINKGN